MKALSRLRKSCHRGGFTLVELLVAIAVLVLVIVMIAQLMDMTTRTIAASNKQVDEDDSARTVFNMMANDFGGMLKRKDVDYFFYKNDTAPGNDSMWFYSHAPSYYVGGGAGPVSESPLTFVGYRIPTLANRPDDKGRVGGPNYVLERVGRGITWTGATAQYFLTYPAASPSPAPSPTPYPATAIPRFGAVLGSAPYCDGDWSPDGSTYAPSYVVSEQVFRMEFCFLMKDGTYMIPPTYPAAGSHDAMRKVGTDVRAIVVAIALLDPKSRLIESNLAAAAAALPDLQPSDLTGAQPKLMAEKWNDEINNGGFLKNCNLPPLVASQVRVYQRTFLIGTN